MNDQYVYLAETDPDVARERDVQRNVHGYTAEHDDAHDLRHLAACADRQLVEALLRDKRPALLRDAITKGRAVCLALVESAERRVDEALGGHAIPPWVDDLLHAFVHGTPLDFGRHKVPASVTELLAQHAAAVTGDETPADHRAKVDTAEVPADATGPAVRES